MSSDSNSPVRSDRFVREGRGLDYWLWELVCDDLERRTSAARIIEEMRNNEGPGTGAAAVNLVTAWEEYGDEVRRTLGTPGFDAAHYIRRVVAFIQEAQKQRMALFKSRSREVTPRRRRANKLIERIVREKENPATTARRIETLNRRLGLVMCSGHKQAPDVGTESKLLTQTVVAMQVFAQFRHFLLLVPDVVRAMFDDHQHLNLIHEALEKLGPQAVEFADVLMQQLRTTSENFSPRTLAAVIVEDALRIAEVCAMLYVDDRIAASACSTLYFLGERARELQPGVVGKLMELARSTWEFRITAAVALGTVTRGTSTAVDLLLELSHDNDVWMKGAAITALGEIAREPEKVVPRLVDCFADYEEPNPDLTYESRHQRVAEALGRFGPTAAGAVPALLARLKDDEGMDRGVAKALGAIGPAQSQ